MVNFRLSFPQELRVETQMHQIAGLGAPGQLGVYDLVGVIAEGGRQGDAPQEISVAKKRAIPQCGLVDNVRPFPHGSKGCLNSIIQSVFAF